MRRLLRSAHRGERGQALVETALILPLLLALTFGVVETGLYMYSYVQAANCAREAARRAAVRDASATKPPFCVGKNISVTITPSTFTTAAAGSDVVARSSGTHRWLVLDNLIPGFPATSSLGATVTMRMEGQKL